MTLALQIRIKTDGATLLGPGRAELLGGIVETGSIAAAGRAMGMSYKRAWALVEAMNTAFQTPLVVASKGGAGGGGAVLTQAGHAVAAAYRALQEAATAAGAEELAAIAALAVPPAGESG